VNARLRPLRDDEFDAWVSAATEGYARSIELDAGLTHEEAQLKAKTDMERFVSDGSLPEEHAVFLVEDDGEVVGRLWVAERPIDGGRTALIVYEVGVDEHARGRGLGKLAMEFAADEAKRRGIEQVGLNVFGGNTVARGLYRSLGYREVAIWMEKAV
jgi:ribosomal protein S18 acetylase RimI-like enzyme